jgi:hypothetical protein
METRSIDLDPETIQKLEKIEQSITYWSRQHSSFSVKADRAKAQYEGMCDSRQQLFDEIVKANNLPEGSKIIEILESGEVKVILPRESKPSGS